MNSGNAGNGAAVRRRIEFVRPHKLANGFNPTGVVLHSASSASSGMATLVIGKGATKTNEKNNTKEEETVVVLKRKVLEPNGLFSPDSAASYLVWDRIQRVGPGFYNEGNTCFLNSTLQCLMYLPPLVQVLLKEQKNALKGIVGRKTTSSGNMVETNKHMKHAKGFNKTVVELFSSLVEEVWERGVGVKAISPRAMTASIRRVGRQFKPMRQEDAHEYLRQLLDCMHEEVLRANGLKVADGRKAETTFISRVFGGYLCNTLSCSKCSYVSRTFNHFQDLSLDLGQRVHSVEDGLATFTKVEHLTDGNEWQCGGCHKKVRATKQMTVYEAPNVLVLQLKRFSFGNMFAKVTRHVKFGTTLLLPVINESGKKSKEQYQLTGVVVHYGHSTHSGHYIAYVKAHNGTWYEMNDSMVSTVSVDKVLNSQAYLLFYTRVDVKANADKLAAEKATAEKILREKAAAKAAAKAEVKVPEVESDTEEESESEESDSEVNNSEDSDSPDDMDEDEDEGEELASSMDEDTDDNESEEDLDDLYDNYGDRFNKKPISMIGPLNKFIRLAGGLKPFESNYLLYSESYYERKIREASEANGPIAHRNAIQAAENVASREKLAFSGALRAAEVVANRESGVLKSAINAAEGIAQREGSALTSTRKAAKTVFSASLKRSNESSDDSSDHESSSDSDSDSDTSSDSESESEGNRHPSTETKIGGSAGGDVLSALLEQSRRGRVVGGEGQWDSLSQETSRNVEKMAVQQRRRDQQERKKHQLSEWDQRLDAGRVKKVKVKPVEDDRPFVNPFQKVVNERQRFPNRPNRVHDGAPKKKRPRPDRM